MFKKIAPFIFITMLISGCQSAYYAAMEKVGTHKRDILITRVDDASTSQEDAKEEFKSALQQLSELISFDGGELQTQYELSKKHFDQSFDAAKNVSEKIASIEHVADALFDEWADEISQYSNVSLKRQSEQQLKATQKRYQSVMKEMYKTENKMEPVLAALKDNMLYLKHNLNAKAIGALRGEYHVIKKEVDVLITQMNKSIDNAQFFIQSLKNESD